MWALQHWANIHLHTHDSPYIKQTSIHTALKWPLISCSNKVYCDVRLRCYFLIQIGSISNANNNSNNIINWTFNSNYLIYIIPHYIFSLSTFWGGPRSQIFGGVPGLRFFGGVPGLRVFGGVPGLRFLGGSQVSDFQGGPRYQIFGGVLGLRFLGVPSLSKGKNFWHQIWLDTCSDWKKKFWRGTPPVKGKFLTPDLAWYMFRLGKKILSRDPPPWNSKKLLWLCSGQYASCVHAGGLSCLNIFLKSLIYKVYHSSNIHSIRMNSLALKQFELTGSDLYYKL